MPATHPASDEAVAADLERLFTFDDALLQDPFPLYERMRQHAPVVRVGSVVAVARYEDVQRVLRGPVTFSSVRSRGSRVTDRLAGLAGADRDKYDYLVRHDLTHIGQQDPPEHERLRGFVNRVFSRSRIAATRAEMTELAESLLDEIEADGGGPFDLSRLSYRLPFRWMCRMLAVPEVEVEKFRGWAMDLRVGLGTNHENLEASYAATRNVDAWVRDLIADRRARVSGADCPDEDLVSQLVAEERDGQGLTDEELVSMFTVMLTTGNTNDLISNAVITFAAHPDQRRAALDDPAVLRNGIEELFRFAPPVHAAHRVARVDCEIAGVPVRAGETVRLMLASANRDPERFADPDIFDVRRSDARHHVDFGHGIHVCLGQWLSRLEIEVALTTLYERFGDLAPVGPVRYRRNYAFHGTDQLLVASS
ncbi:cytochrome P450 [Nocardioides panacihumi]|uniref:Cytochrome P450 n=1 Tax=Nocardioides panacihumi TaxID=400774 RepID=A0ABP5BL37_9ACTN